jgi:hypothetical protein
MDRDFTLVDRLARLHPAVVADCLDRAGLRNQALAPHIRPIAPAMRVAGDTLKAAAAAFMLIPAAIAETSA